MLPSVRALLQQSFHLYQQHFRLLFGYVAWLLLPYAAFVLTRFMPRGLAETISVLTFIAQIVLSVWLLAVLIHLASALLHKKPVDTTKTSTEAWRVLASLAFVILLEFLIISGGLILLIIPGLFFLIWFTFAECAVVLDGARGMAALQASRLLFRGRFWSVLWKSICGPLIFFAIYGLCLGVIALITDISLLTSSLSVPLWFDLANTLLQILLLPVLVLYTTGLYHSLIPPSADGGIKTPT